MNRKQQGFTLVELAIVLVIIGLILGMAFKGKDLIDGAKVKNMQAQYNKVVAGFNIFYEKYGAYPGDGCAAMPAAPTVTCANAKDGILSAAEAAFALPILQQANILTNADIQSVFGQPWTVSGTTAAVANNHAANTNYLTIATTNTDAADARYVCQLDRLMDDGVRTTGILRSNNTVAYDAATDCWSLSGQNSIGIRLLP